MTALVRARPLAAGEVVDGYTVEGVLGRGAFARVYAVRAEGDGPPMALKVLDAAEEGAQARLRREGGLHARLDHPNVLAVRAVLDVEGVPGLLMDRVDGPTLAARLAEARPPRAEALRLFRGVTAGVAAAHAAGIVHRDLKPENVLLDPVGGDVAGATPRVTDFGLARLLDGVTETRSGVHMGTLPYTAPEQIRDAKHADPRADVFSLGCVLYELLCGARAFPQKRMPEILGAILRGAYTRPTELAPDLPPRLELVLLEALDLDPEVRPADAGALLALLDAVG